MAIVSYAQNYEDVILYRALGHVNNGFYIDVGAHEPVAFSVTKIFYDLGWRGINAEPVPRYFDMIQQARPEDINIQKFVGNTEGTRIIYEVPDTGNSSFDLEAAEQTASARGVELIKREVPCTSLRTVCAEHNITLVHFLKIDVEGAERLVLEGMPFDVVRPWIVLVEATEPNSQIMNHHLWEDILIKNEYEFVYFDGLNRFYIAAECSELRDAFQAPPNVFDGFIRFSELQAEERSEALRGQLHDTNQRLDEATHHLTATTHQLYETTHHLTATTHQLDETTQRLGDTERALNETRQELEAVSLSRAALEEELQVMYGSRSWRITKPLRWTGTALRAVKYKMNWKPLAKRLFFLLYYRIIKWPWFFSGVSKMIGVLWPSMHTRLRLSVLAKQESETILLSEAQGSLNGDLQQETTLPSDISLSFRELDVLREFKYWENVVQIKAGKKQ